MSVIREAVLINFGYLLHQGGRDSPGHECPAPHTINSTMGLNAGRPMSLERSTLLLTDIVSLVFEQAEFAVVHHKQRLVLLPVALLALRKKYSSGWAAIGDGRMSDRSYYRSVLIAVMVVADLCGSLSWSSRPDFTWSIAWA